MKYTAQQLKRSLIKNDAENLVNFKVNKYDREYHPDGYREEKGTIEYGIDFRRFVQTKIRIYTLQSGEVRDMGKAGRLLFSICKILP